MTTIKKTIGGKRLGDGNGMKVDIPQFGKTTFNLDKQVLTTCTPGTLIPCYVNIGLPGDKFDIDINAIVKTMPTIGPLFGKMKLQIDVFKTDLYIYNKLLHNNPINVGDKMQSITMPTIKLKVKQNRSDTYQYINPKNSQINSSCVLKYLGYKGITGWDGSQSQQQYFERTFNAIPIINYLDIFKNYYANKQEENFKMIDMAYSTATIEGNIKIETMRDNKLVNDATFVNEQTGYTGIWLQYESKRPEYIRFKSIINTEEVENIELDLGKGTYVSQTSTEKTNLSSLITNGTLQPEYINNQLWYKITPTTNERTLTLNETYEVTYSGIQISEDNLGNIDKIRKYILENENVTINDINIPYINRLISENQDNGRPATSYDMFGLILKTYQADIYNSWLNKETYEYVNGITGVTNVDTSDGLNLDTLNLAQKVYNMLNKVIISGNTYNDYLEATYGIKQKIMRNETPIYQGGCSYIIGFEEVVSTSSNQTQEGNVLGDLAGKGTVLNKEGGKIYIENESEQPCIIMAIASITPYVTYGQGNRWYTTDLLTYDDLHKPDLDGIGFQNLIGDKVAWWMYHKTENEEYKNEALAKQPAWINYMTDYDEVFGDFLDENKNMYMTLNRNYETSDEPKYLNTIEDFTTYIDPTKYNYAFANTALNAQNFWLNIGFNIKARRLMSGKLIPKI